MRITTPGRPRRVAPPLLTVAVLALAACGSGSGSSTSADSGQGSGKVVTVSDASGRPVLVDGQGRALYFSDQEKGGKLLCTSGACGAIWTPLTVPSRSSLTVPPPLAERLGTTARPDGSTQVTLNGAPLYTFSFDHAAGQVNGDGTRDSFDGTDFSWHVATPSGHVAAAPGTPSSQSASQSASPSASPSSSPYGNGGYSY